MAANERLDSLLDNFIAAGVPGCGLAVSYKGEVVYTGYRGMARIEDEKKIDESTIYKIASCTKNITATAVMKLYEEGRFLLNDPLEYYLPFFKDIMYQNYDGSGEITKHRPTRGLTIKDLLMMTSGIPYMGKGSVTANAYLENIGGMYSLSLMELAKKISETPLEFDPGSHWRYGLSYDVLGALVEAITGKTFGEYLKEAIFEPLGMNNTTFMFKQHMTENFASTYRLVDGKHENVTRAPNLSETNGAKLESGGGGLLSTLGDLIKFAGMWGQGGTWQGRRILGSGTIDLMRKNHLKGQALEDFKRMSEEAYPWYRGYGWGLAGRTLIDCQEAGSNGSLGEFGWCGAFGPYILADPGRELGVVYVQQMTPVIGGMQDYCHPRVRNVVFSLLDEWEGA